MTKNGLHKPRDEAWDHLVTEIITPNPCLPASVSSTKSLVKSGYRLGLILVPLVALISGHQKLACNQLSKQKVFHVL